MPTNGNIVEPVSVLVMDKSVVSEIFKIKLIIVMMQHDGITSQSRCFSKINLANNYFKILRIVNNKSY